MVKSKTNQSTIKKKKLETMWGLSELVPEQIKTLWGETKRWHKRRNKAATGQQTSKAYCLIE